MDDKEKNKDSASGTSERVTTVFVRGTLPDSAVQVIADLLSDEIQRRDVVLFSAPSER